MKRLLAVYLVMFLAAGTTVAATTLNSTNKWAWSSGSGWINCRTDITNGVVIGEYFCWGYLWSASAGWISMGDGSPTNGVRYTNTSSNDFGVNNDGLGKLRGYAWSASTGWINFEDSGNPRINMQSGMIDGYAWGGSLGWISFTNLQGFVQTDWMTNGVDADMDGMPDAWEREKTGSTALTPDSDTDGDLSTAIEEYYAGTHPTNGDSFLLMTDLDLSGSSPEMTWTSTNSRNYRIQHNDDLRNDAGWSNSESSAIYPDPGSETTHTISGGAVTQRYYRIKAVYPLSE